MRFLYSLLVLLGTPFVLLYFALRGLRDRAYLGRWPERFGFVAAHGKTAGIWLHAASVGEFNAARPLIGALLKAYPGLPLTVTTLTPTGSERVQAELGDSVFHSYVPLDLPGAVARFIGRLQPQLIIVMETEIWPNLYRQAQGREIPLLIANARLSGRSVGRFEYFSAFVRDVLRPVAWVGAQSEEDRARLLQAGIRPECASMTGNLKFDLNVPASLTEKGMALKAGWGAQRLVFVAGSTHEADENVLIPAFVDLLQSLPDALLILVPRHPERFARTTQLARDAGLRTELHSQGESCSPQAQCFVIDTIGELLLYYACGDVAFVGGSMGEQGGHNALEPAALGKPVLLGPNMANAKEIAAQLILCGAALRVNDQQALQQTLKTLLTDGIVRDRMGQAGLALLEKNRGALAQTMEAVRGFISESG